MQANIIVVGAGVTGLTCAVALREQGFPVRLWARDAPADTTSAIAAAMWFPYSIAPRARTLPWSMEALQTWRSLALQPDSGVVVRPALILGNDEVLQACAALGLEIRQAIASELPPGRQGFIAELPVIDMSLYLTYLVHRLHAAGCSIEPRAINDLGEPLRHAPVVINCTGLGARQLTADDSVYPIRGQVLRIALLPGLRAVSDAGSAELPTYIIPRGRDCMLGGTYGVNDSNLEVDAADTALIMQRCAALEPRLRDAEILQSRVGLRPGRPEVRLEVETRPDGKRIVHNYGHGGAGVTVSWGCAAEVVRLLAPFGRRQVSSGASPFNWN